MSETSPASDAKEVLRQLHDQQDTPGMPPTLKFKLDTAIFLLLSVVAVLVWQSSFWPLVALVWLVGGHFGHTKPLAFHDASHGTLSPVRWRNEFLGHFVGSIIFVPMAVYRYAHTLHHARICTPRDPELWPFSIPTVPRALRILAAVLEIFLGFMYTPLLFVRGLVVARDIPARTWVSIGIGYAMATALWTTMLTIAHLGGWWEFFLVGYIAPVAVAGAFQTLNKYTEHLGLTGNTMLELTRTVIDERKLGRKLSYSMQHVDYHGTHHRYAKIPFANLPAATPIVYGEESGPVFSSYRAAFWDMVKTLGDPKTGSQWNEQPQTQEDGRRELAGQFQSEHRPATAS